MFDIGWSELLLVAVICLFVFGPEDIPKIMYQMGKLVRRFRYMRFALSSQFDDFMENAERSARKKGRTVDDYAAMKPVEGTADHHEAMEDEYINELLPPPEHDIPERPVVLENDDDHKPADTGRPDDASPVAGPAATADRT